MAGEQNTPSWISANIYLNKDKLKLGVVRAVDFIPPATVSLDHVRLTSLEDFATAINRRDSETI